MGDSSLAACREALFPRGLSGVSCGGKGPLAALADASRGLAPSFPMPSHTPLLPLPATWSQCSSGSRPGA